MTVLPASAPTTLRRHIQSTGRPVAAIPSRGCLNEVAEGPRTRLGSSHGTVEGATDPRRRRRADRRRYPRALAVGARSPAPRSTADYARRACLGRRSRASPAWARPWGDVRSPARGSASSRSPGPERRRHAESQGPRARVRAPRCRERAGRGLSAPFRKYGDVSRPRMRPAREARERRQYRSYCRATATKRAGMQARSNATVFTERGT